jgi:hypothetical protein
MPTLIECELCENEIEEEDSITCPNCDSIVGQCCQVEVIGDDDEKVTVCSECAEDYELADDDEEEGDEDEEEDEDGEDEEAPLGDEEDDEEDDEDDDAAA